jgi:hypothetical protein
MKQIKLWPLQVVILAAFFFASCSSPMLKSITKSLPPLADSVEVVIYDRGDSVPENAEILGGIYCGFAWDIDTARVKKEARCAGGNAVEVQFYSNPFTEREHDFIEVSAFILNVNDSIIPTSPSVFKKMEFNDYIVTKEGDTIQGSIVEESKKFIKMVHGYNRQGYRKTILTRKDDILSYHIKDPEALREAKFERNKKLFKAQIAIDGGYSVGGIYALAANVRFSRKNDFDLSGITAHTFGLHYDYSCNSFDPHFIAGSIGLIGIGSAVKPNQRLDFYLDGACDYPRFKKKVSTYVDFLFGYVNYRDSWKILQGDQWSTHYYRNHAIGLGFDYGHDFMLNEHLALGWMYYGYFGIPLEKGADWSGAFNITAGLRYYL